MASTRPNRRSMKGKKPNKRGTSQPNATRLQIERMEHPPMIGTYQVTHSARMRFTSTAVQTLTLTARMLLDTMLVATTATVGYDLFDYVRIKRIEIWSIAAIGTPASVECNFATTTGDAAIHTDTSLGVKPAYISAKPSPLSLGSFYQNSAAGNLAVLVTPAGSIVDVHVNFRSSYAAPTAAANALVGATVGEFYWRGLDGQAAATTNYPPPVGIQTI